VAFDLVIAFIAAANVAMASHLSLDPPRKEPNFQGRLVFCMTMKLGTAMFSAGSLYLLCAKIDFIFTFCLEVSFCLGLAILVYQVATLLGFKAWVKRSSKRLLPLILSVVSLIAFIISTMVLRKNNVWLTTLATYFTCTYISLVILQIIPFDHPDAKGIVFPLILCLVWMAASLVPLFSSSRITLTIIVSAVSGIEAILLAYVGGSGIWKRRGRQHRHTRVPTNPV